MFVYSYFCRSSKYFRIFCTVLQVLLSYINTYTGMISLLHKFCQDHSRQKSNTSIKKRLPHQQHHIGSPHQHALWRCRARLYHLHCLNMPQRSHLHQRAILIADCPSPPALPSKTGKEFICRARARAAA